MFDASLKDRELSFESAPGTTMFLHWLVGMVYVFYFASFILLLREVPRSSQRDLRRVQACFQYGLIFKTKYYACLWKTGSQAWSLVVSQKP